MATLPKVSVLMLCIAAVHCAFIEIPSNVVYQRGRDLEGHVSCMVNPSGDEAVIWSFRRLGFTESSVIFFSPTFVGDAKTKYTIAEGFESTGNYTLKVLNLAQENSGKYTCQLGSDTRAANLIVADPPGIPRFPNTDTLVENSTATFTCTSDGGFPLPEYAWYLGSRQLPATDYKRVIEGGVVTGSALTRQLKNTDHEATLRCLATNILSSANYSDVLNVEFSPRVKVVPQQPIVMRGEEFTLTCDTSQNPSYTSLSWATGNDVINERSTTEAVLDGITEDSRFTCSVTNKHGTGEGATDVTVHYAPVVTIAHGDAVTVDEDDNFVLTCEVDAKPAANIKWLKDGQVLVQGGELHFRPMTRDDAGVYMCTATNTPTPSNGPAGGTLMSSSASIELTVNYLSSKPRLDVNPISTSGEYKKGESVQLECTVADYGVPAAEIRWYKERDSTGFLSTGPTLQITSPQVTDSDVYWCTAANLVGEVNSDNVTLKFIDMPELLVADGNIQALNVSLGTKGYSIQCTYKGFPQPNIEWYKNGELIALGQRYESTPTEAAADLYPYRTTTSSLLFPTGSHGIAIEDHARYSCLASNSAGNSMENYEMQVNVIFRPQYKGYGKVGVDRGLTATIPCEVSSYPPVTSIKFQTDAEEEIQPNSKYALTDTKYGVDGLAYQQRRKLEISNVIPSDYKTYYCVATSNEGSTKQAIVLSPSTVPDSPTNLDITDVTWDSVALTWQPGFDGGQTQTYEIEQVQTFTETSSNERTTKSKHIVAGLSPETGYLFKVYASNSRGNSKLSVEQVVVTPKLDIPVATLQFDKESMTLLILLNSTRFCTKVQGGDGSTFEDVSECVIESGSISTSELTYTSYRALTCVPERPDVCTESTSIESKVAPLSDEDKKKTITIAVVVTVFIVVIVVIVVVSVIILRRKRSQQKSPLGSPKSGHINPIMTPNGVPGEVQFSTHTAYNINSDLEMEDEMDGLPYGDLKPYQVEKPPPAQEPFENLDYVYASVQKKSSEQNKLNEAAVYHVETRSTHMNIHDPSSVSDNSDPYRGPDEIANPYRGPDDLAEFLGPEVMTFHKYPSMSESGYSTPESKQHKRVVYEVIV